MDFLIIAVISLLVLGLIGLITHFVERKSDKWPAILRYIIAIPYALMGGTIAIPGITLILLVQRFFIPQVDFEESVFWYEAIIAPAAYSYFFYKYLTILPKFYIPVSITISLFILTVSIFAISEGLMEFYVVDIVKEVFYTESLENVNSKLLNVVSLLSQTVMAIYMMYTFHKEKSEL